MLDGLKKAVSGAAAAVKGKVASTVVNQALKTDWGVNKLKEELAKMPIPPQAKAMFTKIIENKPELLMKIFQEIQDEVQSGKNQMQAGQSVMMKYQKELRDAMM
jgi:hypothetical protein